MQKTAPWMDSQETLYPPSWSAEFKTLLEKFNGDDADAFLEIHLEKLEVVLDATIKKYRKDYCTLCAVLHHLQELLMLEPIIDLSSLPKLCYAPRSNTTIQQSQSSKHVSLNNQRNNLDPQFRWILLSTMKRLGFESRMLSLLTLLQSHMESQTFSYWSFDNDLLSMTDILQHSAFAENLKQTTISSLISDSSFLSELTEQLIETASAIIANLCGPAAAGPITKKWKFSVTHTDNASRSTLELRIKELTFAEADIGWQTWRSGILLARLLCDGSINVKSQEILELGCGTGMAGILCAKFGAKQVTLTDYHPRVGENALYNVTKNGVSNDIAKSEIVDWFDFLEGGSMANGRFQRNSFDLVLAADVVYASKHAAGLVEVTDFMLKKDSSSCCYFVLPTANLRDGIEEFEVAMSEAFSMQAFKFVTDDPEDQNYTLYLLHRK